MDRIYNILLATGIPQLNEKIKEIQNFNILNTVSSKSELESEIKNKNPHIVIISDWLSGGEDIINLMSNLKKQNRYVRFIYLAGKLNARDQNRINQLGKLVLSGIYDLCISENITIDLIKDIVENPKKEEHVSYFAKNLIANASEDGFVKENVLGLNKIDGDVFDNVYVFTSIKPGTGKSFLSVNTACAIAKYGKKENGEKLKVALIEADMQTLSIGTLLNLKQDKEKNLKTAIQAISSIFDRGNIIGNDTSIYRTNKIIKDCFIPFQLVDNLSVLNGSELTPEEVSALRISPEYYIYLLDIVSKEFDVVIVDTNSSIFHITTYPLLQKAKKCFYILNLDINNVRNNLRYNGTLKSLGILDKIEWVLNEDIQNNKKNKEQGVNIKKLEFTAEDLEKNYFRLSAKIPAIPKTIFLNRLYDGTPIVLDENIPYTKEVKLAIIDLARNICTIDFNEKTKKKWLFF